MIKFLFSFSVFLYLFSATAGPNNLDIKVFIGKSKKTDFSKERSFFRTVDLLASRILPRKKSRKLSYAIVIISKEDFTEPKILSNEKDKLRIYLPEDMSAWKDNHEFFANYIASVLLKKIGHKDAENYDLIPGWLKYAIVAKILRRNNPNIIPGTVSFPGTHALVLSEKNTEWVSIISKTMKPEDGPAYQLFLEASEIILDGVLRLHEGKDAIFDMVELSSKELNPEDLFKGVIIKKLDKLQGLRKKDIITDENPYMIEGWLNYTFRLSSVNVLNPCSASTAEKLFKDNQLLQYYKKTEDEKEPATEERYCKIEEIPEKIKEIDNLGGVVLQKQRELVRIAFAMPLPLQDPVYKIERSLNLILTEDYENFTKEFIKQRQIFYDNLEKQHKVEVYMLKTEQEFVPMGYRYNRELEILKDIKAKQRERWPEMNEYLDSFSDRK